MQVKNSDDPLPNFRPQSPDSSMNTNMGSLGADSDNFDGFERITPAIDKPLKEERPRRSLSP
jgi:hypothetical protein